MTLYEQNPSGFYVPYIPPPPKDDYPLEFTDGEQRKKVCKALEVLWNATRRHSIVLPPGGKTVESQRAVVRLAIDLFLGPDVEFPELT